MPTPLLAGNWKLNGLVSEAVELAAAIVAGCAAVGDREVLIAPSFTALTAVARALNDSRVRLGGQDLFWENSGAFTGEVSGPMLVDAGCSYVIIGHSERRQFFDETDYTVAKKVAAAYHCGLTQVLCVGETLEQRQAGDTMEVVEKQLRHGVVGLPAPGLERLVIAYEPVWAIGTGETATPEQAEEVHARIREILCTVMDPEKANDVRILYGGSVKPDNVDQLMACPNVNGALVGGASLKADDFLRIVNYQES